MCPLLYTPTDFKNCTSLHRNPNLCRDRHLGVCLRNSRSGSVCFSSSLQVFTYIQMNGADRFNPVIKHDWFDCWSCNLLNQQLGRIRKADKELSMLNWAATVGCLWGLSRDFSNMTDNKERAEEGSYQIRHWRHCFAHWFIWKMSTVSSCLNIWGKKDTVYIKYQFIQIRWLTISNQPSESKMVTKQDLFLMYRQL